MQRIVSESAPMTEKALGVLLALVAAIVLSVGVLGLPAQADAATDGAVDNASTLSTQASYETTAAKNAKTIIANAKATSGTAKAKLKKVYAYLATDKSFGGVYEIGQLPSFYAKYGSTYYSMLPSKVVGDSLFEKYYQKYAADMFKEGYGSCFHYAALFGVTAKQMLGSSAIVKLAAGASQHTGSKVDYHAWVEVTLNGTTFVYDTQAGNAVSKAAGKATSFGKFCGAKKGKLKKNYYNYKNVQYITVA